MLESAVLGEEAPAEPTPTATTPAEVDPAELVQAPVSPEESESIDATPAPTPPGVLDEPESAQAVRQSAPRNDLEDPLSTPLRHEGYSVVIIDDEPVVGEVIGEELAANGYQVFSATEAAKGAALVKERIEAGEKVMVVADLKMPTTTGRSFFGGFEVARRVQRMKPSVPVLLMAEKLSDKARRRALELGIRKVAFKSALSKLDVGQYKTDLRTFSGTILRELADLAGSSDSPEATPGQPHKAPNQSKDRSAILEFLASASEQLINPQRSVDISRMVLQVAEKFFERGILFLLKNDRASGLGGFGLADTERENLELVKKIAIEIETAKPFEEVVNGRKTQCLGPELDLLQPILYAHIGRGQATEAALVPMLNNAEVLLILYGDNAMSGEALEQLSALEVFMGQAGMALENVFLQGKLRSLDSKLSVGELKD
jgi:CheY-like chemotaxis protein